jgi:hypothetical protein
VGRQSVIFIEDKERIERLESDLFTARLAIIELMPQAIQGILKSFYRCQNRGETYAWQDQTVEALIEQAKVVSTWPDTRALCPLCGRGSSTAYAEGFAVPVGLSRHLIGWKGPACAVFEAAYRLAVDHWNRQFSAAEEEDRIKSKARLEKRRTSEETYLIAPDHAPVLRDENLFLDIPRTATQMNWAEERLRGLGFMVSLEGRTKSYVDKRDDVCIYADPRTLGQIEFSVYKLPLPKPRSGPRWHAMANRFLMRDQWKNDLKAKYETRVAQTLAAMGRAR